MRLGEQQARRHRPTIELCGPILQRHEGLRGTLRRIEALLDEVVDAHGDERADLHRLSRAFAQFRAELELHLQREDELLFRARTTLEPQGGRQVEAELLATRAHEHVSVSDGLVALRLLAEDYDPRRTVCSTHRKLFEELSAFELELRRQIADEDNGLIRQAREWGQCDAAPSLGSATVEVLPRCCRAWVGEQARAWAHR